MRSLPSALAIVNAGSTIGAESMMPRCSDAAICGNGTGPISPGNHQLAMVATYKGHGYGVFEYLSKFTFTARNQSSFVSA